MQRMPVLAAAIAIAVSGAVSAPRAAMAHGCGQPAETEVGVPFTLNVAVPAEEFAVTAVEIAIPQEVRIDQVEEQPGWTSERAASVVRYTGITGATDPTVEGPIEGSTGGGASSAGRIPRLGCGSFTLRGEVAKKGVYRFAITVKGENGESQTYRDETSGGPGPQLLYAGVEPGEAVSDPLDATDAPDEGINPLAIAAGVGVAAAVVAAIALRSRGAPATRGATTPQRGRRPQPRRPPPKRRRR